MRITSVVSSDPDKEVRSPEPQDPTHARIHEVRQTLLRRAPLEGQRIHLAYLDVLGFKRLVMRDAPALFALYGAVRKKLLARLKSFSLHGDVDDQERARDQVHAFDKINAVVFFSDSIFIFGTDDTPEAHEQVSEVARLTFNYFLEAKLPLRGAIETGAVWADFERSIFLGEGITRAHALAESLQVIGVVAQPRAPAPRYFSPPLLIQSKVGGPVRLCVPTAVYRPGMAPPHLEQAMTILEELAGEVRRGLDLNAQAKYENSAELVEWLTRKWEKNFKPEEFTAPRGPPKPSA